MIPKNLLNCINVNLNSQRIVSILSYKNIIKFKNKTKVLGIQ